MIAAIEKQFEPIAGSRLLRDFCAACGEPMRILPGSARRKNFCQECCGHRVPGGGHRTPPGSDQRWDDIVRAYEDRNTDYD